MPEAIDPRSSLGNIILRALPRAEYERLLPHLEPIALPFKQILYEPDVPIPYVYFLNGGVVSLLTTMHDGKIVEVATLGNEAMAGLPVFLGAVTTPGTAIVQIAGDALRMPAQAFTREVTAQSPLHAMLHRFTQALMTSIAQTVACNRLHSLDQRCSRWLLQTHDRVRSDAFPLTHEFLAQMLGVRRAGVTEAAGRLQKAGLIRYRRGIITVVDRSGLEGMSCECYGLIRAEFARLLR